MGGRNPGAAGQAIGRTEKRPLDFNDLWRMEYVSSPDVSSEGASALFVVAKPDDGGTLVPRIFEISLAGGEARALPGPPSQDRPAYAPDAKRVAFLGREPGGEAQVWVFSRETGGSRQITQMRHGVRDFAWSPDGARLAFTAPFFHEEDAAGLSFTEMTESERAEWEFNRAHMPIAVENLMYKFDETYGVTDGSVLRVCVTNTRGAAASALTPMDTQHYSPAWSPDGRRLALYCKPFKHVRENEAALCVLDIETGAINQLNTGRFLTDASAPLFTAAGIVYAAYAKKKGGAHIRELFLADAHKGGRAALFHGREACHGVGALAAGRTCRASGTPEFQSGRDGSEVYFQSAWKGREYVFRVALDGLGRVERVAGGNVSIQAFRAPAGRVLAFTGGTFAMPAELHVQTLGKGAAKRLTRHNEWLEGVRLADIRRLRVNTRDGKADVRGYVALPPVRGAKPCPAVLYVHGGPDAFFAGDFWFEAQMIAAGGFAAVCCDPRGSAGYGGAFARDGFAWGLEAREDLHAFLDAAIAHFGLDAERLGVTGGSYGGWMTTRLISSSARFKAAAVQRVLCNLATSYGTGDMGFIWKVEGMSTQMSNFMDRIQKSPIADIDRMKTPLLILHGTSDYRCSFEQAEQLFVAMRDRNPEVPVRLAAYPGENHELTRGGKTGAQISHIREICGWFARFLAEGAKA